MRIQDLIPYWPAAAGALILIAAAVVYLYMRKRPTLAELERRRREWIGKTGKMGDALVTDFEDGHIIYRYHVRGIEYAATQDISGLSGDATVDASDIVGSVGVKYDPRNPANSIVVSEVWTGARRKTFQ
jgi:hypothetical protein